MKAQIICYKTTIKQKQLDEIRALLPTITEINIKQYSGEIKLLENLYTKTKNIDFNWHKTLFDSNYDIKCLVFEEGTLTKVGITSYWGGYFLDTNSTHEFYITNLSEKNLDQRARNNNFKTNLAWMFCHEYLHGSVWGNTRSASQASDLPHEWEKQGILKKKLAEDVERYQLLNQTKSLLERLKDLLKKNLVNRKNMIHPIPKEYRDKISQRFLVPNKWYKSGVHNGTDWAVPSGTPIYAPEDGEMIAVFNNHHSMGNAGYYNFGGIAMRVMHLIKVPKLGKYKTGQILGYSGNTGMSTNSHVHLDLWKNGIIEVKEILTKKGVQDNLLDPESFFS